MRIPEEERRKWIQLMTGGQPPEPGLKFEFPAAYPPVRTFLADEEGRIFVKTHENDGRGGVWWDALDVDGRFIARFLFPENEMAAKVKKGKLYAHTRGGRGRPATPEAVHPRLEIALRRAFRHPAGIQNRRFGLSL